MANRYIYLVRHGQYDTKGPLHKLGGPLTRLGRRQAQRTARCLAGLPIDAVYCSTQRRAAETARIMCRHLPRARTWATSLLWEGQFTRVPGLKLPVDWIRESRRRAGRIFPRVFRPAGRRDQHIVVVCHGNLIGHFVSRVLRAPMSTWYRVRPGHNCSICRCVVHKNGLISLVSYNDCAHLPAAMRTG
ncbi:MAG: histidine phosphatase family protein [Planctomycetota bacterium]|nr:histidine phosphatase family protein [Planctomycetota bacterium]